MKLGRWLWLACGLASACAHTSAPEPLASTPTPTPPAAAPVSASPAPLHRVDALRMLHEDGRCGALQPFGPTHAEPLLGGRMTVEVAADGRTQGHASEVPPSGVARRSYAYVQRGTIQLTVIASETLMLPGDDLAGYLLANESSRIPNGELVATRSGPFETVILESTDTDARTGDVRLALAFVVSPEGTLVVLEVVVTTTAEPVAAASCAHLARSVLGSLAAGPGRLDRDGGTRSIGSLLTLEVPAGYVVEQRFEGEVTFTSPAPIGELPHVLTVEVTEHPPNIEMPIDRAGPYLGRTVSWRNLYGDSYERRSALLRIPGHREYARSTAEAPTVEAVHALMDLAGRIRVRR